MGFRWVEDRADTTRLSLGDDAYIDAANYITGAEQLLIANAGLKGVSQERSQLAELMDEGGDDKTSKGKNDGTTQIIKFDAVRQKLTRMFVYIKGWNATSPDGSALKLTQRALESLTIDAINAIDKALDEHIEKQTTGKANAPADGASTSTSASTSEGESVTPISSRSRRS